jgi:hypothetical protein
MPGNGGKPAGPVLAMDVTEINFDIENDPDFWKPIKFHTISYRHHDH